MFYSELQDYKKLIGTDNLEDVLANLRQTYPENSDIIHISGQLNHIRGLKMRGELTNDEYKLSRNKIRSSILSLVEELYDYTKVKKLSFLDYLEPLAPVIVILSVFIFVFFLLGRFFSTSTYKPKLPVASLYQAFTEKKMTAYDNSGRKVELIIFLVRDFNWKLGGYESEKAGQVVNICQHLKEIGVVERLNANNLKGIVCFGNTSFEEIADLSEKMKTKFEEDRADFRATLLANCVSNVLKTSTTISISNLGKYIKPDKVSAYQREIILAGVIQQDDNVINEEALYNGLVEWHTLESWKIDIRLFSKVKNNQIEIKRYLN